DRSRFVDASFAARVTWQAGVGKDVTLVPQQIFDNLTDAVSAWSSQPNGTVGVLAVLDSRTYEESLAIDVPQGSELLIVAAARPPEADRRRVGPAGAAPAPEGRRHGARDRAGGK